MEKKLKILFEVFIGLMFLTATLSSNVIDLSEYNKVDPSCLELYSPVSICFHILRNIIAILEHPISYKIAIESGIKHKKTLSLI